MAYSAFQNYKDGKLDPQVDSFLDELARTPSTPARLLTPAEVRKNSNIMCWVQERANASTIHNITIPGNGAPIPLRIYLPDGPGPFPVLIYFHGGGWVFGSLDEADHVCDRFACEIPAVVVSVDYRLSPENKFPCAIDDAYSSVLFVKREIAKYKGNPDIIAVAGESAGANMATVVCQMLRDRKGPRVCYQLLLCPVTDMVHLDTRSYTLFGSGAWLSKAGIDYYYGQYLQTAEDAKNGYASPLLADRLTGLPPAHIVTAEFDVLRDEGESYAKRLRGEGVDATYKMYCGMIHSFFVLTKVIQMANDAIGEWVSLLRERLY
jgi:acetyl esterase